MPLILGLRVQWRCLSFEAPLFPASRGELTLRAALLARLWLPQIELAILARTELCSRHGPLAYLARQWLCGCLSGSLLVHGVVPLDLSQASLAPGPCAMRQQLEDEVITSTNAEL